MELCFLKVYVMGMGNAIGSSNIGFGEHEERRRRRRQGWGFMVFQGLTTSQ